MGNRIPTQNIYFRGKIDGSVDACLSINLAIYIMMTSSNGNIFRVTGPLCWEVTGPGEFPTKAPVTRSFDVFFDLRLNKDWVNNREAGDLRLHRDHYDVHVMFYGI